MMIISIEYNNQEESPNNIALGKSKIVELSFRV